MCSPGVSSSSRYGDSHDLERLGVEGALELDRRPARAEGEQGVEAGALDAGHVQDDVDRPEWMTVSGGVVHGS